MAYIFPDLYIEFSGQRNFIYPCMDHGLEDMFVGGERCDHHAHCTRMWVRSVKLYVGEVYCAPSLISLVVSVDVKHHVYYTV